MRPNPHLLKKSLMENFIFCAAIEKTYIYRTKTDEKLNILAITCFIKPKTIFMDETAQQMDFQIFVSS